MFSQERATWFYIFGTIILMIVAVFLARELIGPIDLDIFQQNTQNTTFSQPTSTIDTNQEYFAKFSTNLGDFTVKLFPNNAPNTVTNFIYLASQDFYNGTSFHRLVPGILIQGGSNNTTNLNLEDDSFGGPGYTIDDEINWESLALTNDKKANLSELGYLSNPNLKSVSLSKYKLAMASSGPNTSGSQFFIVLGNKSNAILNDLEGKHTVFGEVVQNTETVDKFNSIPVDNIFSENSRPTEQIIISNIEITNSL